MKITTLFYFVLSLYIGGFMLYGGYQKFAKPLPAPTAMLDEIEKKGTTELKKNVAILKIKNYIFGLKQTGFFWQLLGICELLLGIMILSQYLRFLSAVMLVPITLHILLFHVFLEPHDLLELAETALLFISNLLLIFKEFPKWKHLLIIKP